MSLRDKLGIRPWHEPILGFLVVFILLIGVAFCTGVAVEAWRH